MSSRLTLSDSPYYLNSIDAASGTQTVTIAFQGEIEHGDNKGNNDVIGPGDVQWMTAGRGIVHEEFHSKKFTREGGTLGKPQ